MDFCLKYDETRFKSDGRSVLTHSADATNELKIFQMCCQVAKGLGLFSSVEHLFWKLINPWTTFLWLLE